MKMSGSSAITSAATSTGSAAFRTKPPWSFIPVYLRPYVVAATAMMRGARGTAGWQPPPAAAPSLGVLAIPAVTAAVLLWRCNGLAPCAAQCSQGCIQRNDCGTTVGVVAARAARSPILARRQSGGQGRDWITPGRRWAARPPHHPVILAGGGPLQGPVAAATGALD
jgi:hypothetical protein